MPTITVRRFDYEALKSRLRPDDNILVVSCDGCAKQCAGLGGAEGLNGLAGKLEVDGFNVLSRELVPIACSSDLFADRLEEEGTPELFEQADVVIPLSCGAGEQRVAEVLPEIRLLSVTKTLGKGTFSPEAGARLTEASEGVAVQIADPEGIPVTEAAEQLGLHAGRF